jgi:hypothetical protein
MPTTEDFEKLGVFYLGRPYDLAAKKAREGLLLYDSRDLVTHAVCVGMTGSGKTGLCLALLEEAALDGIPAICIDPKGDLGNLLLTFPQLRPEDFAPWVNPDDARARGLTVEEHAKRQADLWRTGLAAWGQDGERIARLRAAVDMAIYTPGSTAGRPVSILSSFGAPPPAVREDAELLRERVAVTATSLLGLLGIAADPIRSREHILLATLLDAAWRQGQDLDLAALIQQIQTPPVTRVGVLDLETFLPSRARFELAMALNNLLAAPGFAAWMEGEPLDAGRLLYTAEGRPRVSIVSIAHLPDSERMFVVSLLLNQVTSWMRAQSGTTSLRAILYMDEIWGYFPPVANPPSKPPLLTLLKQARAFGLGVVLATQNPVDLDYKGLSNAGTWFIGRLQTERDRARVLDGLEGVATGTGRRLDRRAMEQTLGGLGNRVFLLNNVHEDAPEVFETRWVMSYLRGPLTRDQIRQLTAAAPAPPAPPAPAASPPAATATPAATPSPAATARPAAGAAQRAAAPGAAPSPGVAAPARPAAGAAGARPVLSPDVPQYVAPARRPRPEGATLVYRPGVVGAAVVRFADSRRGIDVAQEIMAVAPVSDDAVPVDWEAAQELTLGPADLEAAPLDGARFAEAPPAAGRAKSYAAWQREFTAWLLRSRTLEVLHSRVLREVSRPGESERDFRLRVAQAAREARDRAVDKVRAQHAAKIAALQDRLRRAEQAVERESTQASQQQLQTAISVGAAMLGALLGRKSVSATTLGRATTAARGASRSMKERQDVARARDTVETLQRQLAELEAKLHEDTEALAAAHDVATETFETLALKPGRQGTSVRFVALLWSPWWEAPGRPPEPACPST